MPEVVSASEWRNKLDAFRVKEKAHTRERDALNAERRRLPMTAIDTPYTFVGAEGPVSLLDLFAGRQQLIIHHFMFAPEWEAGCVGCSWMADNVGHNAHLHARNTTYAAIARAPYEKLAAYWQRMGWDRFPVYSSFDSAFNWDFGVTTEQGEDFGISVFLRDGEKIYRSYFTQRRGAEYLGNLWALLDITPFGRQEQWEDSPADVVQTPVYKWLNRHDQYPSENELEE